jgi:serine/threonine protein kinase
MDHPTHTRATSPSYEAPEAVSKEKRARSRKYDIWSLGCIYLEFAIWLIHDWKSIQDFNEERKPKAYTDTFAHFYHDSNGKVEVHPKVNEKIKSLKSNPQCGENSPLGGLIDLIDAHLLRVEVDERLDAEGLRNRLESIVNKAKPELLSLQEL